MIYDIKEEVDAIKEEVDDIKEEVEALDNLLEMYSEEMTRNNMKIASMNREILDLENRNRILGGKIASTLRAMEGMIGE